MGRAEQRFKDDLSKVIYLADAEWKAHAISQKAYIRFERRDHRSMVRALRDLVRELREMGAFAVQSKTSPSPNIADIAPRTPEQVKRACAFVASAKDAIISEERLDWYVRTNSSDQTGANLLKTDLLSPGWVKRIGSQFVLSPVGMELVRYERERPPAPPTMADMVRMLATYPILFPKPPNQKN